jgi:hypothetical protein
MPPNHTCECGHLWSAHEWPNGCLADWNWDEEGLAQDDGCLCQLAHVHLSSVERSYRR